MTAAQMLAHVNVSYEYMYEERLDRPPLVLRLLLRLFMRDLLVGNKPYAHNSRTAPSMVIAEEKDFESEKARLLEYVQRTFDKGASQFEGKRQVTLGPISAEEWSTLLWKHLDHHLRQFGV